MLKLFAHGLSRRCRLACTDGLFDANVGHSNEACCDKYGAFHEINGPRGYRQGDGWLWAFIQEPRCAKLLHVDSHGLTTMHTVPTNQVQSPIQEVADAHGLKIEQEFSEAVGLTTSSTALRAGALAAESKSEADTLNERLSRLEMKCEW